jgi:hypothetical protein
VNQIVYGFSSSMGLEKVASNNLYYGAGVSEDRAVFMTPNYVADLFGAFSTTAHIYDLPWHWLGTASTSLTLSPRSTTDLTNLGYNSLTNVMHASTDGAWNASITMANGNSAKFWAAANPGTEVMTANGHAYILNVSTEVQPPLFIERQSGVNNALFGNVIDISGANYVTGLTEESITIDGGFATLLNIQHGTATDLAFSAFAPGFYTSATGSFSTDGWQAAVVFDQRGLAGAFLGGGTKLSTPGFTLTRTDAITSGGPGMVSLEHAADGTWVLSNPSPTDASIHIVLQCQGIDKTISVKASSSITL